MWLFFSQNGLYQLFPLLNLFIPNQIINNIIRKSDEISYETELKFNLTFIGSAIIGKSITTFNLEFLN